METTRKHRNYMEQNSKQKKKEGMKELNLKRKIYMNDDQCEKVTEPNGNDGELIRDKRREKNKLTLSNNYITQQHSRFSRISVFTLSSDS